MDRPTLRRAAPAPAGRAVQSDAEEVLVVNYRRLARIAYLVLPAGSDRGRRLLLAHAVTQRALAGRPWHSARRGPAEELYGLLRERVVRGALTAARRPPRPQTLPQVWGLRLTTADGGGEALALDRALARLSPSGRAAYALRVVEGLQTAEVSSLLVRAGESRPARARREAAAVPADLADGWEEERFDPCTVRVQPGDLIRRRRAARLTGAAALLVSLLAVAAAVTGEAQAPATRLPSSDSAAHHATARIPDPSVLVRVDPDAWTRSARLDHGVWPARGDRTTDTALLARALGTWRSGTAAHLEPGTPDGPPAAPPHLLYAGTVDGTPVVLLYDGTRIAHWADGAGLTLARADDADVTTAAALTLHRGDGTVRYLLAPWVDTAELRELREPDRPARELDRRDGVTGPVPLPSGDCGRQPVLQLRSAPTVAEKHAFLLADTGGLAPAHLTYLPPPSAGIARTPREATGADALTTWARSVCTLPAPVPGVKSLNAWAFAEQPLPARAGTAAWVCLRTDRWNGTGAATTALLLPGAPEAVRTGAAEGRACSRFDQDAVAWSRWHAPDGRDLLLVASSRRITRLTVHGDAGLADRTAADHTLALDRPPTGRPDVEGAREDGTVVRPLP
ncbi:hypothetical protein [Kitasatospora sp. NBC_01539]|uniref:hypothetical protein n=1 Tax=Kitasatospora sp. NBC_01539 TaxID=2903577 RepID=UPI0038601385